MKNAILIGSAPILKLIDLLYPYMFAMGTFVLILESFSYLNFVSNRLLINTSMLISPTIYFSFLYNGTFYSKLSKDKLAKTSLLALLFSTTAYVVLLLFEEYKYQNFVYSSIHLNLTTLPNLCIFLLFNSIGLWFFGLEQLNLMSSKIINNHKTIRYGSLNIVIILLVALLLGTQIQKTYSTISSSVLSLIQAARLSRHDRLTKAYGGKDGFGWINVYADFINRNTSEDAIIFIPPQMESWQMEGNEAFFRYFIYPRKLLQTNKIDDPIPEVATHVLIAHGLYVSYPQTQVVWPRISIDASQVNRMIYIDRKTLSELVVQEESYLPSFDRESWGIIELKR